MGFREANGDFEPGDGLQIWEVSICTLPPAPYLCGLKKLLVASRWLLVAVTSN